MTKLIDRLRDRKVEREAKKFAEKQRDSISNENLGSNQTKGGESYEALWEHLIEENEKSVSRIEETMSEAGKSIREALNETGRKIERGYSWAVNHEEVFLLTAITVMGLIGVGLYRIEQKIEKNAEEVMVSAPQDFYAQSEVDTKRSSTRIQTLEKSVQTALGRRLEGEKDSAMVMNKFLEGKAVLLPGSDAKEYDSRAEVGKDYISEVNENGEPQGLGYRLKGTK